LSSALSRIAELEVALARTTPGQTKWPTDATITQGFLAGRWQRRNGDGFQEPLVNIPEAPADGFYYGRHNFAWAQVVEEAPELTSRRSVSGWARASFGSDTPWISMDDVLVNYVPEVPVGQAIYGRSRSGGATGWTDLTGVYAPAGNYLDKAGGQMTGPLITRDGGSLTNPGLAVGDNSTGFYRTGGNLLVTTVGGVGVTQISGLIAAYFVPVNFTGKPLGSVGDPVLVDDALNLRTGDARYARVGSGNEFLPLSGGTLTGQLVTQPGTGSRDLAIGVGDDTTGLYRQGNALSFMAQGFPLFLLDGSNRSAALIGPLNMSGNVIANIDDPGLPGDALNLRTGDARYAPIDTVRAKPVLYNVPADVVIPGNGDWTQIANIPCTLPPRPGVTSMLMVSVNCNLKGVNNVAGIGARVPISPTPEQRIFGFGGTAADPAAGFSVNFFVTPAAGVTTLNVAVQLNAFPITGGSPISYTVAGGNVLVLDRSQIVVVDLGPT
jgi:hypothetical protein